MNLLLALGIGFALGFLSREKRVRRLKYLAEERLSIIREQEKAFEELLYEFSHKSGTSPAASVLGLIGLISSRLKDQFSSLLKALTAEQALQQKGIITEIHEIIHVDLNWCSTAADAWLKAARDTIRRYGHYQYPIDSQGQSKV